MPQQSAAASRMLLVGADEPTTRRLRAALPEDLEADLSPTNARSPDAVLDEVRASGAEIVLLGPGLTLSERVQLLTGLRTGEDVYVVTLGPEPPGDAVVTGDDHLGARDDPARLLARCLREASLRRLVKEASRRAERMATVAQVSGGVAHDFGNLLQVIQGQTELLRAAFGEAGETSDALAAIEAASEQAIALVRRLLALGAEPSSQPRRVVADELLSAMAPILSALLGPGQRLELELDSANVELLVDPAALEQAILNLVINACRAMEPGGRLRVLSRRETFTAPSGAGSLPAVVIEIEDDGCGMPREVANRAFEPFFSTRSAEEGSGLGLSSVMDVMRGAGGTAAIESEPGQGTTVRLVLPEYGAAAARARQGVHAREGRAIGQERRVILFVDDEPLVVNVVRNILERAGYAYRTAADADEAEAAFEALGGHLDLLVTDVMMPGRNGRELYEALRAKQPDLPVVFVSGYVDDPLFAEAIEDEGRQRLVPKPFRPTQLLEAVEQVLEASRTQTQS